MNKKNFLTIFHIFNCFIILAQSKDSINLEFIERYKENRELSYTSPLSEIGAPSKYILSGKLTTTYMLLASKKLPVSFAVIPDFTVRVRNENSAGVRTPSFRLGGAFYIRLNENPNHYKYAELGFTHHSNGQDAEATNTDGTINTYNGNFSTNYLTTSYRFGNFTSHVEGQNYDSYNHRVGLEWHKWFAYEKALANNYGFTRLLYNFSLRKYAFYNSKNSKSQLEKEYLRLNADLSYAVNALSNSPITGVKKRLNAEFTANYSLPFMQNVFLMATAGYYGEDPYNIYFSDHYAFLRFGIATGFIKYKVKP
ncbi:hypothetical protein A5893_15490 [Pedobacter psychrophilus]|uniref:Phosphatidylcholine 1-acylhydrolase n=1 Tax=Pedobacter psychrophilus TaxID=1826909 RepID=A0A179DBX9_9SPHI|nr:hypothetical protein [Pedobacter psychrophilus]OAQ38200.1 hypothetical protein A5893_15490 [Pedobacter psychrophilus]